MRSRRFRLQLRSVKERVLPELDDAFAASVSRASTLAELREQVADNLRQEAAARQEREVRERLIDAIAEANPIELPESMVTRAVERMLRPDSEPGHVHATGHAPPGRHANDEAADGWTDRQAEVAEILRPAAEWSLRRLFILDAVARAEGLEPTAEQVDAYLRERVREGQSVEEARRSLEGAGRLDELRHHLRTEHVFEYLKSQSTIRDAGDSAPAEPVS
jgi:trigger factor